ncbi:peroxiredoxin-like family protein [Hyphomicrobium sp. CS1GBMeth3]|uniref:peroxiredoxin-like family protein n=1 Tax=Hyphomicrobium sp. CS1GBMeth3 TaxID=1892845 RepID=UPI00111505C6|nr:peroxiredoxin-like family protein [Hyphomicrobium sp. CS1GBMeth3]
MKQARTLAETFEDICVMEAPLNERLAAYAEKLRELSFPFAEAYDALVARLLAGEIGTTAPAVGEVMPDFILPSKSGRLLALDDVIKRGPAVISFNRGHWCPFCKIELRTIAEHHAELEATGTEVVSIIPDRQEFAGKLRAAAFDQLHVLTDVENGYALSLGLVLWLGDRIKGLMQGRGHHLETYQGADGWFVPLPATFIVGPDKRVLARHVDPDFRRRMEIEEILRTVRAANGSPLNPPLPLNGEGGDG